jgi:hypothetical protein
MNAPRGITEHQQMSARSKTRPAGRDARQQTRTRRRRRAPKQITGFERLLYDADGALLPPHRWPDAVAIFIQSIESGPDGRVKRVRLASERLRRECMEAFWIRHFKVPCR